jgi:lipid-A-disaccharide synthase
MYLEYLLRGISRVGWIALPNIIADRAIVPEFVARDATPENLASALLDLLESPEHTATMKRDLAEVRASLGAPGATERAARLALGIMEASRCGSAQV